MDVRCLCEPNIRDCPYRFDNIGNSSCFGCDHYLFAYGRKGNIRDSFKLNKNRRKT